MSNGTVGIQGVRYYQNYRNSRGLAYGEGGWVDLDYTYNVTNGFHATMTGAGFPATFYWTGSDSWANDLFPTGVVPGGLDSSVSDDVDVFFWSGHSFNDVWDRAEIVFDSQRDTWSSSSKLWRLGDRDLEWLMLYTCDSIRLEGIWDKYQNIFHGLHLFCASWGSMYSGASHAGVGRNVAENLVDGDTVLAAWLDGTTVENSPAVLSAERAETWRNGDLDWPNTTMMNDHFWRRGHVKPDIPRSELGWLGVVWRHYA